jgi:hypothetical protein
MPNNFFLPSQVKNKPYKRVEICVYSRACAVVNKTTKTNVFFPPKFPPRKKRLY